MTVHRLDDPAEFQRRTRAYLRRDPVRHNLFDGLVGTLADQPEVYPRFHLWIVEDGGELVGAALRTEPHNVVLSAMADDAALDALVDALVAESADVPGVIGSLRDAERFTARYGAATGVREAARMTQAIHELTEANDVPTPPGAIRVGTGDDLELLVAWHRAFSAEASAGADTTGDDGLHRRLVPRIAGAGGAGYRFWEDDGPTCLVGFVGADSGTARVGPVYTPPTQRSRGYATALTAQVSRELVAAGATRCVLYTDLANPTSNAIYARIGYRVVCDSAMIRFRPSHPA